MKFQKLKLSAMTIAVVAASSIAAPALAAQNKGAMPSYPNCSSKSGDAKQACMEAARNETGGVESPVTGDKRAQGVAPKYPKAEGSAAATSAAGAATQAKGVAPKYPKVTTDHRGGQTDAATGGGVAMTAAGGAGEPGTKGVAPKFPGKPVAVKAVEPDSAPDKVKVNGVAPKFPKMDKPEKATAASLEPKDSVRTKGVSPKYPKSE